MNEQRAGLKRDEPQPGGLGDLELCDDQPIPFRLTELAERELTLAANRHDGPGQ